MKVQTYTLIGDALNWAVAKCEGAAYYGPAWTKYSTDWAQGGPIIEREKIGVVCIPNGALAWAASVDKPDCLIRFNKTGATPLIAAMRCYVASKLGDEIEIPKELK